MLVLMRKSGQSVLIGNDIEIQILEAHPGVVKVGISAPKEISILRKELINELKLVNEESVIKTTDIALEALSEAIQKSAKL